MSDEYLKVTGAGGETYLCAGGYYTKRMLVTESSLPGCSYDKETNTLTLEDFSEPNYVIEGNLMGNGFTIKLIGDNMIGRLILHGGGYGGSVTFTGSGSLTINPKFVEENGIYLNAGRSRSCVMVDKDVELNVNGGFAAIKIEDSMDDTCIYVRPPSEINSGTVGEYFSVTGDFFTVLVDNSPSVEIIFSQ